MDLTTHLPYRGDPLAVAGAVEPVVPARNERPRASAEATRPPSPAQLDAVRTVMQLLVDDDVSRGITSARRTYCDGCARSRPSPGAVVYGHYQLCHACAVEYEVARTRRQVGSAGQFVHDKRFGEAERYAFGDTMSPPE